MKRFLQTLLICAFTSNLVAATLGTTVTDGLIGYYRFNGTFEDESGSENDGLVVGSPQLVSGRGGDSNLAYFFPAGNNKIVATNIPANLQLNGSNSVSFWMKWDGLFYSTNDLGAYAINFGSHSIWFQGKQPWWPGTLDGPRFGIGGNQGHGEVFGVDYGNALTQRWVHVTAVLKNGDLSQSLLYINGTLVPAELMAAPGAPSQIVSTAGSTATFGGVPQQSSQYTFLGALDDIRIYDRALTATEVTLIYNEEVGPRGPFQNGSFEIPGEPVLGAKAFLSAGDARL